MPSITVKIYEVTNAYVSTGADSPVLNIFTMTIDDNDGRLHANEAADPGAPQVITTDAGTVTDYNFIYDDTISINGVTETVKTFQMEIGGVTRSFIMSDDSMRLEGVEVGDTVDLTSYTGYSTVTCNSIPCFVAGTMIDTPDGPRAVEVLEPGDLVNTRDNGPCPIRWAGQSTLTGRDLAKKPNLRPVRIKAGTFGPDSPREHLSVSPQHRILLSGWPVEISTGHDEVLVAAKLLKGQDGIGQGEWKTGVTYVHIMLDRHEIVTANGLPAESFLFGDSIRSDMDADRETEILSIFPELSNRCLDPARPILKRRDVKTLLAA